MNTKNLKEKMKKTLPAFLLCGTIGLGALAWLVDTDITGNKENLSAGQLSVALINEASAYNNSNAMPQSRASALAGMPYTFTVKNDGTVDEMVRLAAVYSSNETNLPAGKFNVVIQTEDGKTIFDGTLHELQEAQGERYYKIDFDTGLPVEPREEYTLNYIRENELKRNVDYIAEPTDGYIASAGEVMALGVDEEINLKMYAWIDETVDNSGLYTTDEDGTVTPNAIDFRLKAFAVQEQDLFVDETDDNTYEMQWDALVDDVVFDEAFLN